MEDVEPSSGFDARSVSVSAPPLRMGDVRKLPSLATISSSESPPSLTGSSYWDLLSARRRECMTNAGEVLKQARMLAAKEYTMSLNRKKRLSRLSIDSMASTHEEEEDHTLDLEKEEAHLMELTLVLNSISPGKIRPPPKANSPSPPRSSSPTKNSLWKALPMLTPRSQGSPMTISQAVTKMQAKKKLEKIRAELKADKESETAKLAERKAELRRNSLNMGLDLMNQASLN